MTNEMTQTNTTPTYVYDDEEKDGILRMVPADGQVIGSVGCGRGRTEAALVRAGREVHGVDISEEAVAVARTRLTSARVVRPDDWSPFEAESLDGLILADVIEHIPRGWDALKSFARCVRPGGWVVISVPNMRNIDTFKQFVWRGDWPEDDVGLFDATHVQVMSEKRLDRWCAAAGLLVEERFDTYMQAHGRWYRVMRLFDRYTRRRFHSWFMFQLQIRCRKPEGI